MLNPASAFYLRPRFNRDLVDWCWKFYRTASDAHVAQAAPLLRDLNLASRRCYEELAELPGSDFGLMKRGLLAVQPVRTAVAATSVGVVEGDILLDLCYAEDSRADVDFNVVMTAQHEFIEVQGTGEGGVFSRATMDSIIALAEQGINELLEAQRKYI